MTVMHTFRHAFTGLAAAAALAAAPSAVAQSLGSTVHTAQGDVRGGSAAPGVAVFKGIPFAAAPVGNLRFREAQPTQPWSGVLDGTKWGNTCIQPPAPTRAIGVNQATDMPDSPPVSEDCLNLNVWTPAHSAGD